MELLFYKIFKLKGKIGNREVIVLINSEATHNFIAWEVVREVGLEVQPTKPFELLVEDKKQISSTGNGGPCRRYKQTGN